MKTDIFYNLLDNELTEVIEKNNQDEYLTKHKDNKRAEKKSYALLIWFLAFYGQKPFYKQYITEGDDDNSCDIIFSNKDTQGKEVYYIIQSKWRDIKKKDNTYNAGDIDAGEFKQTLNDFETLLRGDKKKGRNEKFNQNYEGFINHLKNNGEAKFIFFSLDKYNTKIEDNINSFNKNYAPQISLEVIDIEKIKRDFIEFRFKQVKVNNPLAYKYIAEDSDILLEIERFGESIEPSLLGETSPQLAYKRDFLEMNGRAKAYIFVLKPKTIYQLFEKYGFGLFFKNVRNPLHDSNYNPRIVKTLKTEPSSFWYFNNGITAITKIVPSIGIHAQSIKIQGLQVINGAQTVYSIYAAYHEASITERQFMDSDARIMFRLIRSSDEGFNMEVTRYTNSQNPMYPRDFKANDEIQIRLQEESFKTNYWYERRRGEFREQERIEELGIETIDGETLAPLYAACYLQNPVLALLSLQEQQGDLMFISHKEDRFGLYEEIFENAKYEDMLASYQLYFYVFDIVNDVYERRGEYKAKNYERNLYIWAIPVLSLSGFLLPNYLRIKYSNNINLSRFISENIDNDKYKMIFEKVVLYALHILYSQIFAENNNAIISNMEKLIGSPQFYLRIKENIENQELDIKLIENMNWEVLLAYLDEKFSFFKSQ